MNSDISMGAKNATAEQIIKKYLNLGARGLGGSNWDAYIHGLAQGEEYLIELAKRAFNQLFLSTSEGKYLLRNISNVGFTKPKGLGISEETLRNLAIKVTSEKLTLHSILEVLEAFYGAEAIRSTIDSKASETFNLKPYSELIIENNKQKILVVFKPENFTDMEFATTEEISEVINYYLNLNKNKSYAKEVLDPVSGFKKIRLYSGDLGLGSYLRILGGEAQNVLQFPNLLNLGNQTGTSWLIETVEQNSAVASDVVRFTYISGPQPNLNSLSEGDYLNAYSGGLNENNIGTFFVKSVGLNYFEIENIQGNGQSFTQITDNDLIFFSPVKNTINSNYRVSLAAHANPDVLDILYSTTTQIINRTPNTAAYIKETETSGFKDVVQVASAALFRNTNIVTVTSQNHDFQVNDSFYLFPGEEFFPPGVKKVVSTTTNTFSYAEPTSEPLISAISFNNQYIYSNFRDSSGNIIIKPTDISGFEVGSRIVLQDFSLNNFKNTQISYKEVVNSDQLVGLINFAIDKLDSNTIIVAGGSYSGTPNRKTFLYNIKTNTWTTGSDSNFSNYFSSGITLNNGRFLLIGDTKNEIYDPKLNSWIPVPDSLGTKFYTFSLIKLNSGKILIIGPSSSINFSEIYDPVLNSFTATGPNLVFPRYSACSTKLSDGRVLVSGGIDDGTGEIAYVSEIYNPDSNSWSDAGSPNAPKYLFNSFLVRNSGGEAVLEFGGYANDEETEINVYNPITNFWSDDPPYLIYPEMSGIRLGSFIYFFGGLDELGSDNLVPIKYNTINKKYTTLPSMSYGVRHSVPIDLGNNKILLVGGDSGSVLIDLNLINFYGNINNEYKVANIVNNQVFLSSYSPILNNPHPIEFSVASKIIFFKSPTSNAQGPFIYDNINGAPITSIKTTLTKQILKNENITSLEVTDTSNFPSEGYLILDFGRNTEKRNIYYNKKDETHFFLTFPTLFTDTYNVGKELIFLKDRFNFNPQNPEDLGSFYLTDSNAGRIAANDTIDQIVATGIKINKKILYPNAPGVGNWESTDQYKVSDKVYIWGNEEEVEETRNGLL